MLQYILPGTAHTEDVTIGGFTFVLEEDRGGSDDVVVCLIPESLKAKMEAGPGRYYGATRDTVGEAAWSGGKPAASGATTPVLAYEERLRDLNLMTLAQVRALAKTNLGIVGDTKQFLINQILVAEHPTYHVIDPNLRYEDDVATDVVGQTRARVLAIATAPTATPTDDVVFAQQPVIEVRDEEGSVEADYTGNITVEKLTGSGTLAGTLTVAAVAGVATFTDLEIQGTGAHTLRFTAAAGDATQVDSGTLTVS